MATSPLPAALDPRALRAGLGLTLADLAEQIGSTAGTVSRCERRELVPDAALLARWATALGVGAHLGALAAWWADGAAAGGDS